MSKAYVPILLLMRTYSYLQSLLVVGALAISSASAQNSKLKSLLDKAGLKYTVKNGNFHLTFETEDSRTQVVVLVGSMEELHGEPIAYFFSPGFKGTEIDDQAMARMLADAHSRKVGNWELTVNNNEIIGIFAVKVPLSSLTPTLTRSICIGTATVADEMEKTLLGTDNF